MECIKVVIEIPKHTVLFFFIKIYAIMKEIAMAIFVSCKTVLNISRERDNKGKYHKDQKAPLKVHNLIDI